MQKMANIFDKVCRVCESTDYLEAICNDEDDDILSMLQDVAGSNIQKNGDQVSDHICHSCIFDLDDFFQFKTLYKSTYSKFKIRFGSTQVKVASENDGVQDVAAVSNLSCNVNNGEMELHPDCDLKNKNILSHQIEPAEEYLDGKFSDSQGLGYKQGESDYEVKQSDYHEIVVKIDESAWEKEGDQELQANEDNLPDLNNMLMNEEVSTYAERDKSFVPGKLLKKPTAFDSNSDRFKRQDCSNILRAACPLKGHEALHSTLRQDEKFYYHQENNPKHYECNECEKSFKTAPTLKLHLALHSNPNLFNCELCKKSFTSASNLKTHKLGHSTKYKCDICNKSYMTSSSFNKHKALHTTVKYQCKDCGKLFKTKDTFKTHVALHSNPDLFKCDLCEKAFETARTYRHHRAWHSNPDLLKCDLCGKSFKTISSYKDHKAVHLNPNIFKCDTCNKLFASSWILKEHQSVHANPEKFKCKQCGKIFSSANRLKDHTARLCGHVSFECDLCGKLFSRTSLLKVHKAVHSNPDLFKCDLCGRSFQTARGYNDHKAKHPNPNAFKCEVCNKSFKYKYNLKTHMAFHLNPDEFKCKECGKSYISKQRLNEHTARHSPSDLFVRYVESQLKQAEN